MTLSFERVQQVASGIPRRTRSIPAQVWASLRSSVSTRRVHDPQISDRARRWEMAPGLPICRGRYFKP